jgi:hypothetical protein
MIGLMNTPPEPMSLPHDGQVAIELLLAIRGGDLDAIRRLLAENPGLASARISDGKGWRTPLHMVTDWPGYFPNGPAIVALLAEAGADPDDRGDEPRSETPLHWAASSDDAEVAAALIDAGAEINGPQGSIGTPIENAVGYGCLHVARLLVARGARIDAPWVASALGDQARLEELLGEEPAAETVNQAFWHAVSGGQLRVAQYLKGLGADVAYSPEYAGGQPVLDMASNDDTRRQALKEWLRSIGAQEGSAD